MAKPINYNPISRLNVSVGGPKFKVNALSYGKLMEHLVFHGPSTYKDLVDACGLEEQTIRGCLLALRGRMGDIQQMVRISGWDKCSRGMPTIMVFEFAPGKKDVPRPRMSCAERSKRYRQKKSRTKIDRAVHSMVAVEVQV